MDKTSILGKNLDELRRARKLNQEAIAKTLGVTPGTYSSWERGRTEPSINDLIKLARYFNIAVDRLLRAGPRPLRIGSWILPINMFHPIKYPSGFFSLIYPLVFNRLYHYDIYEGIKSPELIKSWTPDIVDFTYTFYLKRNVTFHSGDPLGPEDVKLSYELFLRKYDFYNNFIDGIDISSNEFAIQIRLKTDRWLEMKHLPMPFIIPRSYARSDVDECFDGTGPYKLMELEQRNRIREGLKQPLMLESNDAYFDKLPSIEFVEYQYFGKSEDLEKSINEGKIDLAYEINPREIDKEKANVKYGKGIIAFYLILQQDKDIFKDVNFRKAIDLALDRESIIKNIDIEPLQLLPEYHLYLILREPQYQDSKNNYNEVEFRSLLEKSLPSNTSVIKDFTLRIGSSYGEDPFISTLTNEVISHLVKMGIKAERESDWQNADALVQPVGFHHLWMINKSLHSHSGPVTREIPWNYQNTYIDHLLENIVGMDTYRQIQSILLTEKIFLPLLRKGITIAYTKDLNFEDLDISHKFQVTNAIYGPNIVYWRFDYTIPSQNISSD